MNKDQVKTIVATPAQRMILLNLSHAEGQKLKGQRGRVFRRFIRAFGIEPIIAAANAHPAGMFSGKLAADRTPAVFDVTIENIEYALELAEVEHAPVQEMVIGPLFDQLEDAKAGREPDTAGIAVYDPATEDWERHEEKAPATEQRIADYLRAQGHPEAAALVDRGGWDRPAPNGKPAPQPEGRPEA